MSTETKSSKSSARKWKVRRFLLTFQMLGYGKKTKLNSSYWVILPERNYFRADIKMGCFNIWEDSSRKQKSFHLRGKVSPLSVRLCSDRSLSIPRIPPEYFWVFLGHPKTTLKQPMRPQKSVTKRFQREKKQT